MAGTINSFVIGAILVFVIALDTTSLLLATATVAALLSSVHCTTLLNEVRLLFPGLKMDTQAYDLLMVMRNGEVAIETKASLIGTLKSDIKNRHVPENAVSYIFEIVRTAIASPHSSLSSAGFTTLGYLLKRLNLQDQLHVIASQGPKTYPILMERLGDHKEKVRDQVAQSFTEFWSASPVEVEHFILEGGLTSKSARTKERSLVWLSQVCRRPPTSHIMLTSSR
jgi:CLIP-associating protein 1/2